MSDRPHLRALSSHLGIVEAYPSALDGSPVATLDSTRVALCCAMGRDASTEQAAARALEERLASEADVWLEPVRVVTSGEPEADALTPRWPAEAEGDVEYRARIEWEGGGLWCGEGRGALGDPIPLPSPPPGVHELRVEATCRGAARRARQRLIAAPRRCVTPEEKLGPHHRAYGIWASLYSARSEKNWGVGDFGDLRTLIAFAADEGAAAVGLNPLHALGNREGQVSPYSPLSRLFRNELYLELDRVPELSRCPEARRRCEHPAVRAMLGELRAATRLDLSRVLLAKRGVLEPLHRCFTRRERDGPTERGRAYERFRRSQGETLLRFATYAALAEEMGRRCGGYGAVLDWRSWPAPLRDAGGEAVEQFRRRHAEAVDFQMWLQFELDRQLGEAASSARSLGLGIGLCTDLALGSVLAGSDVWSHPGLFASGVSVGAPPDAFARDGQDWCFPPIDPRALRDSGYDFWIRLLRAGFAHAGALRIDHVMALRRLYWIPAGRPAREGAYVLQPEPELLAILALESQRQNGLVIGEDLGTVPEGFSSSLQERGILSSRVLYFERDENGLRPADHYPRRALASVNTHDLPPLAALLGEEDLELRRRVKQIPDDEALAAARAERRELRSALFRRVCADGTSPEPVEDGTDDISLQRLAPAVTRFLCDTPSALVGLSLDDLTAECEPINLPGVSPQRHPSWTRRMSVPLGELGRHPTARATLDAVPGFRRSRPTETEGGEERA